MPAPSAAVAASKAFNKKALRIAKTLNCLKETMMYWSEPYGDDYFKILERYNVLKEELERLYPAEGSNYVQKLVH